MKPLLRNDDVNFATTAKHLQRFCEITDRHGYQVIHAITPRGVCWTSDNWLGGYKNSEIVAKGAGVTIESNPELLEFLRSRANKDSFGIHGLWHTHRPRVEEILQARTILIDQGLYPLYFVPPFNEGSYKSHDFIVSGAEAPNFELGRLEGKIVQLHSWRYDPEMWRGAFRAPWYTWEKLEDQLGYPAVTGVSASNQAKYDFLAPRIKGRWLDVGCNIGRLLERVPGGCGIDSSSVAVAEAQRAGHNVRHGQAEALPYADGMFDTVVLCGLLEQCADWKQVLVESLRVAKGRVIGTCPYPGTPYGTIGSSLWVKSVIPPEEFPHVERINDEHYYFCVTKQ